MTLKRLYPYRLPILGAFFLIFCSIQIQTLPIQDEAAFHRAALKWSEHGPTWDGLWHTPLYLECLSVWLKWFASDGSSGIAIIRSFGVLMGLVTWLILMLSVKRHRGLISLFFLFNPYFLNACLLIDIDNTLLVPPLFLATLWMKDFLSAKKPLWSMGFCLTPLFVVALMTKEITPLLFVFFWIALSFLTSKKHLIQSATVSAVTFLIFLIVLLFWTRSRGFNWFDPLELTFMKSEIASKADRSPNNWVEWIRLSFLTYLPFLWIGVPTLFFIAALFKSDFPKKIPTELWISLGLLVIYSFLVQKSYYFPKYTVIVWPLIVSAVSRKLQILPELGPLKNWWVSLGLMALLGFSPFLDPLLLIEQRRNVSSLMPWFQHGMACGFPIIVLVLARKIAKRSEPISVILIALLGAWFFGQSLRHGLQSDISRGYLYGETKIETVFKKLNSSIDQKGEVVTTSEDLQWAFKTYFQRGAYFLPLEHLIATFSNSSTPRALITRSYGDGSIPYDSKLRKTLQSRFQCHLGPKPNTNYFEIWWNSESDCILENPSNIFSNEQ